MSTSQKRTNKNYLRTSRLRAGLTQSQLAELLGIGLASRISALELGKSLPTVVECVGLKWLFGRSFGELWPRMTEAVEIQTDSRVHRMLRRLEKDRSGSRRRRVRVAVLRRALEALVDEWQNTEQ